MHHSLYVSAAAAVLIVATAARADVTISSAPTQDMNCSGGVCAPTGKKAVLNVGDLQILLSSGNVEVTTTGSGVQADNLAVDAALTWSSTSTLALDAHDSIAMSKSIAVAGIGGLTLTTNDGGSNGTLSFGPKGNVTFQNLSSVLTINGTSYTLENSVKSLASAVLANPNGAFALASSYDASQDGTYSNCPIDTTLSGTLQGLGNTISNLAVTAKPQRGLDSCAGLILSVGASGVVESLRLKAIEYKDKRKHDSVDGGLAGENYGSIFGNSVSGSIVGAGAGGLVGVNYGTIVSSSANVHVRTFCCNGGFVGGGGLVANNAGSIELSHASGDVSGVLGGGGLTYFNEGWISESYATGNVSQGGGLVYENAGAITNSYATGAVNGANSGGLIYANNDYSVTDSYSTGLVRPEAGGFVCDGSFNLSDDYWDTTTSGTTYGVCNDGNVSGVTGLTTLQLQSGLPAGFDPSIWAEDKKINNGLPYLINNPPEKK